MLGLGLNAEEQVSHLCVSPPGEPAADGDEDAREKQEESDLFLCEFRQQKDAYYREKLHLKQITP